MKQMVLVFFDMKGIIYVNLVPKGKTVNTSYIRTALARSLKAFKAKRPIMSSQKWTASVVDFLVAKGVKMVPRQTFSSS
jgi:hypothetical protein